MILDTSLNTKDHKNLHTTESNRLFQQALALLMTAFFIQHGMHICMVHVTSRVPSISMGEMLNYMYRMRRNFRQEKIFANFTNACRWRNFFPRNFCSVKTTHYFLPRAQTVGEIKFGKIFFCPNTKHKPLAKFFSREIFVVYGMCLCRICAVSHLTGYPNTVDSGC